MWEAGPGATNDNVESEGEMRGGFLEGVALKASQVEGCGAEVRM